MGVGVEDALLAPESEFQLQAAYSPSPLPAPVAGRPSSQSPRWPGSGLGPFQTVLASAPTPTLAAW